MNTPAKPPARRLAWMLLALAAGGTAALVVRVLRTAPATSDAPQTAVARESNRQTPRAPAKRSVPRLAPATSTTELETRPGTPGYDPRKLADVMGLAEVFRQEPRAATWAGPVETWLSERMTTDLPRLIASFDPKRDLTIECRTTVCRLAWTDPALQPTMDAAMKALYSPVRIGYGSRNEMYAAYYGGDFYRDVAPVDPPSLFGELERLRARNLRAIRSKPQIRKANGWDVVPLESWPEK